MKKWHFEKVIKIALKFDSASEWVANHPSSYQAALRNGWLNLTHLHFKNPKPRKLGPINVEKNKELLMSFVDKNKRKPSRYSKNKEERRLWNVMVGYTTKTNKMFDAGFKSRFDRKLKGFGFKFKNPQYYWTETRVLKEAKRYKKYSSLLKYNKTLHTFACRLKIIDKVKLVIGGNK